MLIPIPIGEKVVATAQGAVWKFVFCAKCKHEYAYLMELEATGADHNLLFLDAEGCAKRAQAQAEQNLLKKSRNLVLPVPCPYCGFYKQDMVIRLKEDGANDGLLKAGLVVVMLSLIPMAFSIHNIWIVTLAGTFAGLSLIGYGEFVASRFDPNAGDPEARKVRGRRYALWGEQLNALLATNPSAIQNHRTNQPHENCS